MTKHKRRKGYWRYYERASEQEVQCMKQTLLELIRKNPCPHHKRSNRGRPSIHSKEKLDFASLWMMAWHKTYRETESDMKDMQQLWNEPTPDHTTIVRHMQTLDENWMDSILAETAELCCAEAKEATGPINTDSSGVETTRYEESERPNKTLQIFADTRVQIYKKYHIVAMAGLQIIFAAATTASNVNDTVMLPVLLEKIERFGFDFSGYVFNADKGYDSDKNCEILFRMGMTPNIKQRKDATNRSTPHRRKAAKLFDSEEYKMRALIEAIFGAEETKRHQLQCRFLREDNRRRFSRGRAIAWNIKVLNRFKCANQMNIPIPSYGRAAHA